MKKLSSYINEKFIISADTDFQFYDYHPRSKNELVDLVNKKISDNKELKEEVIDMNDIDTSKIVDFSMLFYNRTDIKKIDISKWETKKVKNMNAMFAGCYNLISIGDLSNWDVSSVTRMSNTFSYCKNLKNIGNIENWNINPNAIISNSFNKCGLTVPSWAE